MKINDFLLTKCNQVRIININEELQDIGHLSKFELENINCTSSQHKIVGFLIEMKKQGDIIPGITNNENFKLIDKFYKNSLSYNSPLKKGIIL